MKAEFFDGLDLFLSCWNAPIERVAIENPVMHDIARRRLPMSVPRPQLVQPFWFGHPEYKETGLYLRGLPRLIATDILDEPEKGSDEWKAWHRVWRMPPGADRGHERSRFFPGIAAAMAQQWAGSVNERAAA